MAEKFIDINLTPEQAVMMAACYAIVGGLVTGEPDLKRLSKNIMAKLLKHVGE